MTEFTAKTAGHRATRRRRLPQLNLNRSSVSGVRRLILVLTLVTAACSGAAVDDDGPTTSTVTGVDEPTTTTAGSSPTTGETTGTTGGDDDTTDATEAPPTSDRPSAPDFTLELGTGGEYTLSDSDNPVYLVFWAEW